MAGSMIYIDPDAASADISKLSAAISRLEEAQSSIRQLNTQAGTMTGQTGQAIQEKCTVLSGQLDALKENLNYTIRLIRSAVREYQEKDSQYAGAIRNGGV